MLFKQDILHKTIHNAQDLKLLIRYEYKDRNIIYLFF